MKNRIPSSGVEPWPRARVGVDPDATPPPTPRGGTEVPRGKCVRVFASDGRHWERAGLAADELGTSGGVLSRWIRERVVVRGVRLSYVPFKGVQYASPGRG